MARARATNQAAAPAPLVRTGQPGAEEYAECRAMQHQWRHRGVDTDRQGRGLRFGGIAYVSVCTECGTVRTKWLNRRGDTIGSPEYDRSACPNYSTSGDEKKSTQQWRRTFVTKLLEPIEQNDSKKARKT